MATNHDLTATWDYHNGTKHSRQSVRSNPHYLDWENKPLPFKIYSTLEPLPLPRELPAVPIPILEAIAVTHIDQREECIPNVPTLAALLYLSAGITKQRTYPGGQIYFFRAAACTGALYHIDVYLVCGDLAELPAGVYHFEPRSFTLRRLRAGDYRGVLAHASGGEPAVMHAPVTLVGTSTYWRNTWKYQARTYRHCFWDAGTLLANLLAAAAAREIPVRVVAGFVDTEVNRLLDLESEREVALALVPLGRVAESVPDSHPAIEPLNLPTVPLSETQVDYPAIRSMHAASSLTDEDEAKSWRGEIPPQPDSAPTGPVFPLTPLDDAALPAAPLDRVIRQRGSTRFFAPEPLSFAQLSTVLARSTQGVPADFLNPIGATLIDLYLIVNAVEGLPAGTYVFHRNRNVLELLRAGNFRREAGYLGLGQELPADASVNIFCLAELPPTLQRFGNRGYRAAQLEAALIGGKCYLAAYGLQLGATGLTFFDDEVTAFFSPHAAGKSVMFLTAVGKPARKQVLARG
ncbi:MAG TPA: SagB/ThcOx family dehydrogenase [Candidatus Binatia bacterium]|jgi:SagB-type dehydrogenase family enzyme|nr:SagB/ThcOx family dehydrogenase [Candidatus Binatia bacterium]